MKKELASIFSKLSKKSTVTEQSATSLDHTPPSLQLKLPLSDSISVNASSATISIEVTDESGIDTVFAYFGTIPLQTSVASINYSVTVTNLVPDQYTTVTFIARDASGNSNMDTLFVTIKYDPTASDETGPVIKQISGPNSESILTDPLVLITDSITDPSGVDSVFWRLNNGPIKLLTAVISNVNQFLLTDSLTRTGLDTIVITAVDNSEKRNRSVQMIILNYVIAPEIIEQPAVTTTVIEGDSLKLSITATGTPAPTYQWYKDSVLLSGGTSSEYTIAQVTAADNGTYYVVVSNGSGTDVVSTKSIVTVNPLPVYKVVFAVDCGTAVAYQSVTSGEKVIKPATNPTKDGFEFSGWYTSSTFTTEFDFATQIITSDTTIFAKWTKTYTLTITNYPTIGGSIVKSPDTITYTSGTIVTITANANSGYRFKNWIGDYSDSTNSVQITMTKDYTITANFLRQYTVTFSSTPEGRGSVTTPTISAVVVDSGVALDIEATPTSGFKFKKWTSANSGVSFTSSTATITKLNISGDVSSVDAQAVFGCITFRKNFPTGYSSHSVVQGNDGSYGVYCHLSTTTGDGVIIKLNTNGDSVWEKTVCHLGIYDESDSPFKISKSTNGYLLGKVGYDGNPTLVEISPDENATPTFTLNPRTDLNTNLAIGFAIQTNDGGFLLAGRNESRSRGMAIKTNTSRQITWSLNLDSLYLIKDGQQTQDNGFILTDRESIAKINSTGTVENFFIKIPSFSTNSIRQISATDGYIAGGYYTSSGTALVKLLPDGTIASGWPKTYNTSSTSDVIVTVRITSDGSFVFLTVTGSFIKTNSSGEILWSKKLSSGGNCMEICSDGGFIILSESWIMKTDENGNTD